MDSTTNNSTNNEYESTSSDETPANNVDPAMLHDEIMRLREHYSRQCFRYNELEERYEHLQTERDHLIELLNRQTNETNQLRHVVSNSIDIGEYERTKIELDQLKVSSYSAVKREQEMKREIVHFRDTITKLQDDNIEIQRRNDMMSIEIKAIREQSAHEKAGFEKFILDYSELLQLNEQNKETIKSLIEEKEQLNQQLSNNCGKSLPSSVNRRTLIGNESVDNLDKLIDVTNSSSWIQNGSNCSLLTMTSLNGCLKNQIGSNNSIHSINTLVGFQPIRQRTSITLSNRSLKPLLCKPIASCEPFRSGTSTPSIAVDTLAIIRIKELEIQLNEMNMVIDCLRKEIEQSNEDKIKIEQTKQTINMTIDDLKIDDDDDEKVDPLYSNEPPINSMIRKESIQITKSQPIQKVKRKKKWSQRFWCISVQQDNYD
ncbi:hypothetical protein RDWZM_008503 [Blomia tropicalis]|uniref:Uncharacterized protein n=1 Tax=Blomia tropicalis TaxID=40697 RepID=A0A9Q0RLH1_BLOTA|nr:hypothetical protein RDWZM_008503 [Blomia tropicalis]